MSISNKTRCIRKVRRERAVGRRSGSNVYSRDRKNRTLQERYSLAIFEFSDSEGVAAEPGIERVRPLAAGVRAEPGSDDARFTMTSQSSLRLLMEAGIAGFGRGIDGWSMHQRPEPHPACTDSCDWHNKTSLEELRAEIGAFAASRGVFSDVDPKGHDSAAWNFEFVSYLAQTVGRAGTRSGHLHSGHVGSSAG
jgi:hypothetical protein